MARYLYDIKRSFYAMPNWNRWRIHGFSTKGA